MGDEREPLAAPVPPGPKKLAADIGNRVYWLALLVGLAVGGIAAGFHAVVDLMASLRAQLVGGGLDGSPLLRAVADRIALGGLDPTPAARFAVTLAGVVACLAGARWLVRRWAPEAAGSGVQEIEGALLGLRPMRWRRILAVKFAGGGLALGAGFVLGREGPTVQMGGAAAIGLARLAGSRTGESRALLAAGAGAGIAAAFNAPIAGALFVAEELRREAPYNFQGYHAVLIACVAATLVTQVAAGVGPELRLTMTAPLLWHYPFFIGLGVVLGAAGALFNRLLLHTLDLFAAWSRRAGWSLVLALSLGLTALLLWAPAATGGGEQIVEPLTAEHRGLTALLLLLALRTIATLGSYGAAAPGGVFAPLLGLATVAGLAYGEAASLLFPDLALEPAACVAGAMAALFTGSVRAPLVGVALVAELTDAYPALLAITLSAAMASLTAAWVRGRPLYELLLERSLRTAP